MIETLIPTAACAEAFSDVSERPCSRRRRRGRERRPERRREFATVRHCARLALRQIGLPPVPILPDPDRAPQWPAGVVGSMTHCAGYRAAVAARPRSSARSASTQSRTAPSPRRRTTSSCEPRSARGSARSPTPTPSVHWDRIVFCAKEAVYKAWFPLTRRWLGFADLSTTLHPDGSFRARLLVDDRRFADADPDGLSGRWATAHGLVAAATWVES